MTFVDFFRAVWGSDKRPFPWQEDLAEMAVRGEWPQTVGLPPAAGRTALVDIAVFALAMRAPNAARRIFFVADRRVFVQQAAERAHELEARLAQADPKSDLGRLVQNLRDLGGNPKPLVTAGLGGSISVEDFWTASPIQPAIICTTVDELGSSVLFRAYGASEYARPVRASLATHDSLIILDEVHTSQPFAETLRWIGKYRGWAKKPLEFPFTVVQLTAVTPADLCALHESERDRRHPILKRRWETEKRAKLVLEDSPPGEDAEHSSLVQAMSREARILRDQRGARVIGVIANRVSTARSVYEELKTDVGCNAVLLTGRARPWDRDRIWKEWKRRIGAGRTGTPDEPIFVVATQCIEAGPSVDLDALVTEIASIDALQQRFGRLARNGSGAVRHGAIVALKQNTAKTYSDPVYGQVLPEVWRWLTERTCKEECTGILPSERCELRNGRRVVEEFVPMGVLALRRALQHTTDQQSLTMPCRTAPVLLPAHLDLLCQTSPEPAVSPEPAIFLHGAEAGAADVRIVWRQDLEPAPPNCWDDIVAICPPDAAEAISVPLWAVRKWLSRQPTPELSDVEGLSGDDKFDIFTKVPVLEWRADETRVLDRCEMIRPDSTLVVAATFGGCDEWGWNPESTAEVVDIGDAVKAEAGQALMRLHPNLAATWKYSELATRLREVESADEASAVLAGPIDSCAFASVRTAITGLLKQPVKLVGDPAGDDLSTALTGRGTFQQGTVQASYTSEVALDKHLAATARLAESFGQGLPEIVRRTVVRAAELHDIGKADVRFQAWLRGGNPVKLLHLLAKSARSGQNRRAIERARDLARYPKGGRHELMSVALLVTHEEDFAGLDFDLLLHLIATHHGRCRPFAPAIEDDAPVAVTFGPCPSLQVTTRWCGGSDHHMDRAGSGISERFWRLTRRYGWYGLSFLETIVRLSDQRQSEIEMEEERGAAEAAYA